MDNSSGLYNYDESNQYSDDDDDDIDGGFSLQNAVVDELGSDLKKSLKFDNSDDKKRDIYDEEEEEDEDITEGLLVQMGYGKTKARPVMPEEMEEEEEEEDENGDITEDLLNQMGSGKTGPPKHEPPAIPIPADNLKSAIKGSSKKEELPNKERKVTWAQDVYDPIPSAMNRTERHRTENKKSGKNRQKCGGKGASGGAKGGKDKDRGGGGKDKEKKQGGGRAKGGKEKGKKQVKKFSSSSSKKCYDTLDENDT